MFFYWCHLKSVFIVLVVCVYVQKTPIQTECYKSWLKWRATHRVDATERWRAHTQKKERGMRKLVVWFFARSNFIIIIFNSKILNGNTICSVHKVPTIETQQSSRFSHTQNDDEKREKKKHDEQRKQTGKCNKTCSSVFSKLHHYGTLRSWYAESVSHCRARARMEVFCWTWKKRTWKNCTASHWQNQYSSSDSKSLSSSSDCCGGCCCCRQLNGACIWISIHCCCTICENFHVHDNAATVPPPPLASAVAPTSNNVVQKKKFYFVVLICSRCT